MIWRHGRDTLEFFPTAFESSRHTIKFTMETETGGQLSFIDYEIRKHPKTIDVLVKRDGDKLMTYVIMK